MKLFFIFPILILELFTLSAFGEQQVLSYEKPQRLFVDSEGRNWYSVLKTSKVSYYVAEAICAKNGLTLPKEVDLADEYSSNSGIFWIRNEQKSEGIFSMMNVASKAVQKVSPNIQALDSIRCVDIIKKDLTNIYGLQLLRDQVDERHSKLLKPLFEDLKNKNIWYNLGLAPTRFEAETRCLENGMRLASPSQANSAGQRLIKSMLDYNKYNNAYPRYAWAREVYALKTDLNSTEPLDVNVFGPDVSHESSYEDRPDGTTWISPSILGPDRVYHGRTTTVATRNNIKRNVKVVRESQIGTVLSRKVTTFCVKPMQPVVPTAQRICQWLKNINKEKIDYSIARGTLSITGECNPKKEKIRISVQRNDFNLHEGTIYHRWIYGGHLTLEMSDTVGKMTSSVILKNAVDDRGKIRDTVLTEEWSIDTKTAVIFNPTPDSIFISLAGKGLSSTNDGGFDLKLRLSDKFEIEGSFNGDVLVNNTTYGHYQLRSIILWF